MKTLLSLLLLIPSLSFADVNRFNDWLSQVEIDAFTDETKTTIFTNHQLNNNDDAQFGFSLGKSSGYESKVYKSISSFYLFYDDYVCGNENSDRETLVNFRVDKKPVYKTNIINHKNKKTGYGFPDSQRTKELIDQMFQGNTLNIRVYDQSCGQVVDYSFSLSGLTDSYNFAYKKGILKQ
tara:strand:- start:77 stop:616 length:540 start_codon:yes stop_codon:yes gene_type:complete